MLDRKETLLDVLVFSVLLAALDFIALTFFLFWRWWWFDIPMHILGGFVLGLIFLTLYHFFPVFRSFQINPNELFLGMLSGVLIAGIGWELFEYYGGLTFDTLDNYQLDTIKDVLMDLSGSLIAYRYFCWKWRANLKLS
jgi:hypothetical protein